MVGPIFEITKANFGGFVWFCVCVLALVVCVSRESSAQDESERDYQDSVKLIRGLSARTQFDLVDVLIRQNLADPKLSSNAKCEIVLAAIQSKSEQATVSTGGSRDEAWQSIAVLAEHFHLAFPDHPKAILVDIQDALANVSRGRLIQQEIAAEIQPATAKQKALDVFRQATSMFSKIEKIIDKQIPLARPDSNDEKLTRQQWTNLKNNVRYQLAVINLSKAELYDSSERLNQIDALNQVLERLQSVLNQSNPDLPLWWNAQVSRLQCLRIKKDEELARKILGSLPDMKLSDDLMQKLLTERVLLAVVNQSPNQWTELMKEYSAVKQPSPLLQLAMLKMTMATAANSKTDVEKRKWQGAASNLVSQIELNHGPYWGRRAEVLLVGSVGETGNEPVAVSDYQILVRQGESAFRKQNYSDAVAAFKKALGFAANSGNRKQALSLAVRVAQAYEKIQQHAQAAEALFSTATQFSDDELAAPVHLRGCWNVGKQKTPDSSELLQSLKQHVGTWPDHESSNQANYWLGNLYQTQKNWSGAVDSYLKIDLKSSAMVSAFPQLENSLRQWVDSSPEDEQAKVLRSAINKIKSTIEAANNVQTDFGRQLVLLTMELGLPNEFVTVESANQLLNLSLAENSDPEYAGKVKAWRVVLLAKRFTKGLANQEELDSSAKELPNDSKLLDICLQGIKRCSSKKEMKQLSSFVVLLCDKALSDSKLKDKEPWVIEKAIAEVADGGQAKGLQQLALKYPKSLKIQLAYARSLANDENQVNKALVTWRRLASKVKKGSDAWYEAKLEIVKLMGLSGKMEDAIKLVKYLEATTSGWQESEWKSKFDAWLRDSGSWP